MREMYDLYLSSISENAKKNRIYDTQIWTLFNGAKKNLMREHKKPIDTTHTAHRIGIWQPN